MPSVEEGAQPEMLIDTEACGPAVDGAASAESAAAETRSEATKAWATAADAIAAAVEAGTTVAEAGASAEAGAAIEDAATQSGTSVEVVTTAQAGASAEGIAAAKAGTTVDEAGASEASEPGAAIEATAAQADASAEADAVAKVVLPAEADPKAVAAANVGAGDTGLADKASAVNGAGTVFFTDIADEVFTIAEGCESPPKEPGEEDASPTRSEASALKRISLSQLRKETHGDDDYGLDRKPSARNEGPRQGRGLPLSLDDCGLDRQPPGINEGSDTFKRLTTPSFGVGGVGAVWRNLTPDSSMPGDDCMTAARSAIAVVGAGNRDAEESERPFRGTWQGTAPLIVRSALMRNTLWSLQREKIVGQSSLAETDSNLFANLPAFSDQVSDPSTFSTSSRPPIASPSAAGAKVQAGDDGGGAARATEADAASGQGRSSDWDLEFLQELTMVVQEDLQCGLPQVTSSRGIIKDTSAHHVKASKQQASTTSLPVGTLDAQRLMQDLQRMRDQQEVEAARSKQLIDRLAVLEAENKWLEDLAQGTEKELSLARHELEILRERPK